MKKIFYIPICMMLFCCACSDADINPNPTTQAQQITMTFRCGEMSPTRSASSDTRIDDINLYLFPVNGGPARHIYIAPVQSVVLELPKGDYTLYAIANLARDTGDRAEDFVRTLRVERDPLALADAPFPMSAQQAVTVRGDTQIAVSLVRAVAKVNFSYTVAADFAKSFRVKSVQLRSVPLTAALLGSSRADAAGEVADMEKVSATGTEYNATYYLLENRQGQVAGIGSQQQKDEAHAPEYATYIAIEGKAANVKVVYRIYLGENNTTDFNVVRNRVYNIDARILGLNTVDWRVSTAELTVTPFAENHAPGEPATTELRLTSTNNPENVYYLSYHIDAGTGIVAIDGVERNPGMPYPLLSGNGTVTADISYKQAEPGDVRLRLTVTDKYGFSMERVLTTVFKNPELTITYAQQGNELTVYDRAYIDYTVSQPGYSGNYTVKVEGVPSVYYGRYGSDVPLTTFTQYGNGTNTLRVKPNMLGPNPLKITVTDTDGHSAEIITSVMGIKTTADLQPTFSTSGGLLYVTVESSQPVVDDLTVKVTANADIYSFGGAVTKKQYIVTVKIEADHTTGKGSVSLSGLGSYATFTVTSYSAEFKRTSDNGLVEYKLQ
mgnify:CR=1 FL=1